MKKVILIHQKKIQHYRVPIYNYLTNYLRSYDFLLEVVSNGIEKSNPYAITFNHIWIRLNFKNLVKLINRKRPDAIIFWINLKNLYLFPILFYAKLLKIKTIYWGHAINLENKRSIKNIAYNLEHSIADSIILYSEYLKKYIKPKYHHRTFVANNTLNTKIYDKIYYNKNDILSKYGIETTKNIISIGRMQRRKRIEDLVKAYDRIRRNDIGLILVGPDTDNILQGIEGSGIYKLGPIYDEEKVRVMISCDLCCLPGHVGLGIVDAFYCGLPLITEDVDHAPEISYLKDGVNGFMVPKGDISALAEKMKLLIENDQLRLKFSRAAKVEAQTNAHIDKMCEGFRNALDFVFKEKKYSKKI